MRTYCITSETLLKALWWPKWEGNPRNRGYMYTCAWFTLLYSRNWLIVKQLYSTKKKKKLFLIYASRNLQLHLCLWESLQALPTSLSDVWPTSPLGLQVSVELREACALEADISYRGHSGQLGPLLATEGTVAEPPQKHQLPISLSSSRADGDKREPTYNLSFAPRKKPWDYRRWKRLPVS